MKILLCLCVSCYLMLSMSTGVRAQSVTPEYDYSEYYITETSLMDDIQIIRDNPDILGELIIPDDITELTAIEKGDTFWLNIIIIDKRDLPRDITENKPNIIINVDPDENAFSAVGDTNVFVGEMGIHNRVPHISVISIPLEYSGTGNTISIEFYYVNDGGIHVDTIDDIMLDFTLDQAIPYQEPDDNDDNSDNSDDGNGNNNDNSDDNNNNDNSNGNSSAVVETPTPTPPIILLQSIDLGGDSLIAGESFKFSVISKNISTSFALEDVTVTLDLPEEISLNAGTMPGQHISVVSPGGLMSNDFNLKVRAGEEPQTVAIKVIYDGFYRDEEGDIDDISHTHEIMVSIVELERFSISALDLPESIELGQEGEMKLSLLNKSNTTVNNIAVTVNTQGSQENIFMWVGNLSAGTEEVVEIALSADSLEALVGFITVSYENSQTSEKNLTKSFSIDVSQPQENTRVKFDESVANAVAEENSTLPEISEPERDNTILSYISIAIFAIGSTYALTMFLKKIQKGKQEAKQVDKTALK